MLVEQDNCCLSCILFPDTTTQKCFSKDVRSEKLMPSSAEGKSSQTFNPNSTLLLPTRVFVKKELQETQVD